MAKITIDTDKYTDAATKRRKGEIMYNITSEDGAGVDILYTTVTKAKAQRVLKRLQKINCPFQKLKLVEAPLSPTDDFDWLFCIDKEGCSVNVQAPTITSHNEVAWQAEGIYKIRAQTLAEAKRVLHREYKVRVKL